MEKSTKENYKFFVQKGKTADDFYQVDKDEEKLKGLNFEIKMLEEKFKRNNQRMKGEK